VDRRDFLKFITAGAGGALLYSTACAPAPKPSTASPFFPYVRGPMPLATDGLLPARQAAAYANFDIVDDLVLPEGVTYEVIAVWGDRVGDSRFGYNNDYLSLIETGEAQGYLTVNFEYISPTPWSQACEQITGRNIPFAELQKEADHPVNAFLLKDGDPLKEKIRAVCKEALIDQGLGIIALNKGSDGKWVRANAAADRRITGISGLEDNRYLGCTGPARAIFRRSSGRGYIDKLDERIIGTFANCAGGTTPWGTVLSCEENIQFQVPEGVYPDGTSFEPGMVLFTANQLNGQGNVFGLAGNKYGWVVEVDPANPGDYGRKHTWLGRYRHEAVAIRAVSGKPMAAYSGCDRTGGHLYKFVSRDQIKEPTDKANSRLFENGALFAAKFSPDGRGRWIALTPGTPVDPNLPGDVAGNMITLPLRPTGGAFRAETDADVATFKSRFRTLDDLYEGSPEEKQGAILIDAHQAANAAGATCTARPEDTDLAPDGSLYISFTSGTATADGGADLHIFKGPGGAAPHEYGFLMRLREDGDDPAALSFRWEMLAMGGEPADGGMGFANPDNLLIDTAGNVWMVTDISTERQNRAVPARNESPGKPLSQSQLSGLYGNNTMWFIPTSGPEAGRAYLFAIGPVECEFTGPYFSRDEQTLFLSVQHPGEVNGKRIAGASESREFMMKTTEGVEFKQVRRVPVGSNWPRKGADDPPLSAVVAIHSPGKHFRSDQA
jgi:secreted PhoX family phosphatase